jgi:hypothetical protein
MSEPMSKTAPVRWRRLCVAALFLLFPAVSGCLEWRYTRYVDIDGAADGDSEDDTDIDGDTDVDQDSDADGDGDTERDADIDGDVDTDRSDDADIDADIDGDQDQPFECDPGAWGCYENTYYECDVDGTGRINETPCDDVCDPRRGCVVCLPGSRRCEGDVSYACSSSGDVWYFGRDCSEWGSGCVDATGFCDDACAEAESSLSYVGCEYWPVALANESSLDEVFDYRVVVANPNDTLATVRVFQGTTEVFNETVDDGGQREIVLPWIAGQSFGISSDSWQSLAVPNGAYRLISDLPVAVSQFNPFEYTVDTSVFSFTNDASLLLPSHALTRDYVGLSYVPFSRQVGTVDTPITYSTAKSPGYLAVVGISPDPTSVSIEASGHVAGGGTVAETSAGSTLSFTVTRGEVVHVAAAVPPDCLDGRPGYHRDEECTGSGGSEVCEFTDTCREVDFDLTGSRVRTDQPVVVFGGHICAQVPYSSRYCDHLEVQLPPLETWGTEFFSMPLVSTGADYQNLVRVVAAFDSTEVIIDPAPEGLEASTFLDAGEWLEFFTSLPFNIRGSEAIMVGQFMLGQYHPEPEADRGDPAMTVLVPSEQYRDQYILSAPSSYRPDNGGQSFVMLVRPSALELTLDGLPISTSWLTIAGREVTTLPIESGTHVISGAEPFGMVAFGLGTYTSYAYPAGLNLGTITSRD